MIEYRSIADLNLTILNNLHKVPRDIDLVVGIPRSGLLAATILALHLNLPLTDLDGLIENRIFESGRRYLSQREKPRLTDGLRVIILDDSVQSGSQMNKVRTQLREANLIHDIIFGAVYASPQGTEHVDIYFEILPRLRVFEWNILHHEILQHSCVDIDGVLCSDPTNEQNDDGLQYMEFLANAEPLVIPKVPIGWLVTCRLEKYRRETEEWLSRHNVNYQELVMMECASKAERVRAGSHGKFKADVFNRTGARLFIESSARQASEIAAQTGKPVFCLETRQVLNGGVIAEKKSTVKKKMSKWYRKTRTLGSKLKRSVYTILGCH